MNGTETQPISVQCSVSQGSVLRLVKFISCMEDVGSVFNQHRVRHHLFADNKQAYVDVPPRDIVTARSVLMNCIHDINSWCSSRRLQLNGEKTELIWFGSRHTSERQLRRPDAATWFHRHRTCHSCVRPRCAAR